MKKILMILISLILIACSQQTANNYSLTIEEYNTENIIEISEVEDMYNDFINLDYDSVTCDGIPEYIFSFESGDVFQINLSDKWIWKDNKEAILTDNIIKEIEELLENV